MLYWCRSALLVFFIALVVVYLTCYKTSELDPNYSQLLPREYCKPNATCLHSDMAVCSAIIRGELVGNKDEIARFLQPQERLTEEFYRGAAKDCNAYMDKRGFITAPLSAEERDFPIAYAMTIHHNVELFERLLRALYHPQNVYCVHVDQKSPEGFHEAVRAIASCFPNVFVASKLVTVSWGTWSITQGYLNCMDDLLNAPVEWKYMLNTCGSDFPIKTNAEMVRAMKLLNGQNSIYSDVFPDHLKHRWQYHHNLIASNDGYGYNIAQTEIRKTPPPIPLFYGSSYVVVTREFVKHVLEDEEAQNFMEWSKDTHCPEEHLWASLNRLSSVPGSVPAHSKYHRTDMTAIARLVNWSPPGDVMKDAAYPPCTSVVIREVCVLGVGDLPWVFHQHHLMANKFDPQVDDIAIRCVEAILISKR